MNLLFRLNLLISIVVYTIVRVNEALPRSGGDRGYRSASSPNGLVPNVQCGGTLRAPSGEILSPNFPRNYPDEADCKWKIIGEKGTRITITFADFAVEASHNCDYDSLEIYEGGRIIDSKRVAKYCGTTLLPHVVVSRKSTVLVRFHSDFSVNFKGFRLRYTQSGCSHRYTGLRGALTSPNHPDVYPLSVECFYQIEVPRQHTIVLSFSKFEVEIEEDSNGCVYDYVEVFDGPSKNSPSLGRFCGKTVPAPLRSRSNTMTVKFVADQSISHGGFHARFRAEPIDLSNPCAGGNGGCSHLCSNRQQRRVCSCYPGYRLDLDQETCSDINECHSNNGGCPGQCVNTLGSFQCGCSNGYTLSQDNRTCVNINECASKQHKCEQLCRDTDGSYYCECHKGYQVGSDGFSCEDQDECKLPKSYHHCSHFCVNTPGSYYCKCRDGFLLSANGRVCRDQDECMLGGVKCSQMCINTPGSFYCSCFQGFRMSKLIPNQCDDINECLEGIPDCHRCFNLQGSHSCECDDGYVSINNRTRCKDIDECMANNGGCSQLCVNTAGDYHCKCEAGYKATDSESRSCVDINECAPHDGKGDCDHTCTNTGGSFECSCHAGYALSIDGLTCHDVNECAIKNGGCRQKCINTAGNYSCACHNGYLNKGKDGNDYICEDIDECALGLDSCASGSTCVNTPGNYTCTCPKGFKTDWNKCIDVDECRLSDVNKCEQLCNNTEGSFHCYCSPGYSLEGNGKTCSDINECLQRPCEKNCINIEGSYLCMCPDGYRLSDDRKTCEDINECQFMNADCEQTCVNTNGSHYCQCRHGYQLLRDGKTCRDIDECKMNTACCNHDCVNTEGGYNCSCYQGFSLNGNCTCIDIDECAVANGGCQQTCINKGGGYGCSCATGFVVDSVDPSRCVDIDECKTDNGGCQHNCTNTIGTYQCTCHPKFKLQPDGKSCGHCPTCDDFESLLQTVEVLKRQVASFEAWRRSTNKGCIDDEFGFHLEQSSWKKTRCDICTCEKGKVICEPIMGCNSRKTPTNSNGKATPLPSLPSTDDPSSPSSTVKPSNSKEDPSFTINRRN